MKIILASNSPRRKELLHQIGLSFSTQPALGDEHSDRTDPGEIAEDLSYHKAVEVAGNMEKKGIGEFTVIGADTVVSCFGHVLGKPADEADASRLLHMLQGGNHQVYTGVTIAWKYEGTEAMFTTFSEVTDVTLYSISDEEIEKYIKTGEPMDKAGAYGIQGLFAAYVQGICGDYNNVVGLPVGRLYQELKKRGLV